MPPPIADEAAPEPAGGTAPGGVVSTPVRVAVCWDLDGTVLHGGRIGGDVLREAFAAVTGLSAPDGLPMGGLTDRLVADAWRDMLGEVEAAPLRARGDAYGVAFADAMTAAWAGREAELAAVSVLLPGVGATVAALAAEPGVVQVVVTGNVRAGAEAKLAAVGLLPGPLDLEDGAFGHLPGPRAELVRHSHRMLTARHGPGVRLVVVGDTPRDVEAAHEAGALAVGVATGSATAEQLRAAGAEHVLDDLSDPDHLVAVVRGAGEDDPDRRGSVE